MFKSNIRKQSTAGLTAAADVQSASIRRGNRSWARVEKPGTFWSIQIWKRRGGLRKVVKKVKNAFVKGVKALVRADEVAPAP